MCYFGGGWTIYIDQIHSLTRSTHFCDKDIHFNGLLLTLNRRILNPFLIIVPCGEIIFVAHMYLQVHTSKVLISLETFLLIKYFPIRGLI